MVSVDSDDLGDGFAATLEEAGRLLGVSTRTARRYVAALGLERTDEGWPLGPLEEARDVAALARGAGTGPAAERLLRARIRERRAKGRLAAVELAVERGELLPRAEEERQDVEAIRGFKRRFLEWERSLPPMLVGLTEGEITAVLRRQWEAMIQTLITVRGLTS